MDVELRRIIQSFKLSQPIASPVARAPRLTLTRRPRNINPLIIDEAPEISLAPILLIRLVKTIRYFTISMEYVWSTFVCLLALLLYLLLPNN
jgi:hypothetical protein